MSSSDVRMLDELTARVAALETRLDALFALAEVLAPKDISGELYGAEANHAADREARAAMVKRPLREPQDKLLRP